jgi:hypothetical protein
LAGPIRPELNLEALAILAADYEAANIPCAVGELRRRFEFYREKEILMDNVETEVERSCLGASIDKALVHQRQVRVE